MLHYARDHGYIPPGEEPTKMRSRPKRRASGAREGDAESEEYSTEASS
jgi:hypothetical protein